MPQRPATEQVAEFGPFRFERASGFLYRDDQEVALPPRAAAVLDRLLEEPGALVSKDALLASVWGDTEVTEYSLVEAVKVVRSALEDEERERRYVQTVHGRGYRFVAPVRFVAGSPAGGASASAGEERSPEPRPGSLLTAGAGTSRRTWALLVVVLVAATAMGWLTGRTRVTDAPSRVHVQLSLPEQAPLAYAVSPPRTALSPDGRSLAYVADVPDGQNAIYRMRLDRPGAVPVPGTERGVAPTFSPDGQWLAFFSGGGNRALVLKKTSLESQETIELASAGRVPAGTHWAPDGHIYFSPDRESGILRVSETGGDPEAVTTIRSAAPEVFHHFPQLLTGREEILFVASRPWRSSELRARSLGPVEDDEQVGRALFGRLVDENLLLFDRDGDLWATTVDSGSLSLEGARARVATDVDPWTIATSEAGVLVYARSVSGTQQISWFDRGGDSAAEPSPTDGCMFPTLAPDDRRIVLTCPTPEGRDIMLVDSTRGTRTRLTFDGSSWVGIWTPNGEAVIASTVQDGRWRLVRYPIAEPGASTTLHTSEYPVYPQDISADGEFLVFQRIHPETGEGIWRLPMSGGEAEPLVDSRFHESGARLSPDGRWLAYHSNEADGWHVYTRDLAGAIGKTRVSTTGGGWPVWSHVGDELFYLTNRSEALMVLPVDGSSFGIPTALFAAEDIGRDRRGPVFDVTRDGSRIVARTLRPADTTTRLHIMWNWIPEVRDELARAKSSSDG